MKIRTNYVSNSSSSSYIIAVDENFYGNLEEFFYTHNIGYDTRIGRSENIDWDNYCEDDVNEYKAQAQIQQAAGKAVYEVDMDYDHCYVIDLLKQLNENNGGDKLVMIYNGEY